MDDGRRESGGGEVVVEFASDQAAAEDRDAFLAFDGGAEGRVGGEIIYGQGETGGVSLEIGVDGGRPEREDEGAIGDRPCAGEKDAPLRVLWTPN